MGNLGLGAIVGAILWILSLLSIGIWVGWIGFFFAGFIAGAIVGGAFRGAFAVFLPALIGSVLLVFPGIFISPYFALFGILFGIPGFVIAMIGGVIGGALSSSVSWHHVPAPLKKRYIVWTEKPLNANGKAGMTSLPPKSNNPHPAANVDAFERMSQFELSA